MENGFSPDPRFESLEERIKRVPLPNQLPPGLDFTGIPAAALKSSTLESLIGQNEDLMARLSVSLRKINELETTMARGERDVVQLRQRYDGLKEQFLVLREKDRISVTRTAELQRANIRAREAQDKLEREFAGLFVQAQAFQRRLKSLERYRARVRRASPNLRARAREATVLREHLTEAQTTLAARTAEFDERLSKARQHLESLEHKAAESDRLLGTQVELENTLVTERRRASETSATLTAELDEIRAENERLRRNLESELEAGKRLKAELDDLRVEVPSLRAQRETLTEQVESLQGLWSAKQRELERAEDKNGGLQKLNQSLSVTLNERRREMQDLRALHEQERFATEARFDTLRAEIKMLRRMAQTKD